jgi:hypothetical protein
MKFLVTPRILLFTVFAPLSAQAAFCKGEDPCKACKDCSSCAYCDPKNPKGGSCGTCRDQSGPARDKAKSKREKQRRPTPSPDTNSR